MNRIAKEVAALKGARIVDAVLVGDMPMLIIVTPGGKRLQVEAWQDAEGNGPGYLSIGAEVTP